MEHERPALTAIREAQPSIGELNRLIRALFQLPDQSPIGGSLLLQLPHADAETADESGWALRLAFG